MNTTIAILKKEIEDRRRLISLGVWKDKIEKLLVLEIDSLEKAVNILEGSSA